MVGGVAAGLSAASQARRVSPELEIRVYEKGADISYSACGLPYFIAGQVADADSLRVHSPEFFYSKRNIRVYTGHEVTSLSPGRRRVTVTQSSGQASGQASGQGPAEVEYDRLILATGAEPVIPAIPGVDLRGVFHVNTLESTLALERFLQESRPRTAAVIGTGYIGLEMVDALAQRGLRVTLVERSERLFGAVDDEISALVEDELERHGARVLKDSPVAAVLGCAQKQVRSLVAGNTQVDAGCVILATGLRPRVKLAEEAGISIGATGAIAVDEHMETSVPGVYAAGDCVESRHLVSGRPVYIPLGTTANKQGRIAGENAAGGGARFAGVAGAAVTKVFELEIARTGLCLWEAQEAGYQAIAATIRMPARARYLGGTELVVRLVADRGSGRLLGAQLVGREGAVRRVDVVTTALQARMTVEQFAQLDISYAPPFSTVWDPLLIAAQETLRNLKRH